jgi:hypothetical protein
MKKYIEFIKEGKGLLNSLSNKLLKEKLDSLVLERDDLNNEIMTINTILNSRKDSITEDFIEDLPESIFDFNKEQLEFIFENHNGVRTIQYKASTKYFEQLKGVSNNGFNPETNQFKFHISTNHWFNYDEDAYHEGTDSENILKSIKFLGDNLKRKSGHVEFGISFYYHDGYNEKIRYFDDNELYYTTRFTNIRFDNIKDMIKHIVEKDCDEKENSDSY